MKHTIQSELCTSIARHSKTVEPALQSRNTKMILYYYGFGDSAWPSLEDTAHTWGLGTRERARQIKDRFLQSARAEMLPSLVNFIALLETSQYWVQTELSQRLADAGLVDGQFSLCGIFNLAKELALDLGYAIYTPHLDRLTRASLDRFEEYFIIRSSDEAQVRKFYRKARRAHRRSGLARLSSVTQGPDITMPLRRVLEDLVLCSDNVWTERAVGDIWYLFEDRDNRFFNNTEKVFSVVGQCDSFELSEAYRRSLGRYRSEPDLPPADTIARYLKSSSMFSAENDVLRYVRPSKRQLSSIEHDLVAVLATASSGLDYAQIKSRLRGKGHTDNYIKVTLAQSPLVSVDKAQGRTRYRYYLIGNRQPTPKNGTQPDDSRYAQFAKRLLDLSATDASVASKRRLEQDILRDWLFQGKEIERCAMCGKRYRVEALVAAHKKKRAECNAVERRDPRIVMPLCVFGCDFVYENRCVRIEDGVVSRGVGPRWDDASDQYVSTLLGTPVVPGWLQGPRYYFMEQK